MDGYDVLCGARDGFMGNHFPWIFTAVPHALVDGEMQKGVKHGCT